MDLILEILIPYGTDIPGMPFSEPTFEWQGEKHIQGPPEADFGSNFKLVYRPLSDYIRSKLPDTYASVEWHCIMVNGPGVDIYARKLWADNSEYETPEDLEEKGYSLKDLLETICAGIKWGIVIDIDEPIEIVPSGIIGQAISALNSVIKGDIQEKGFLFCGDNSQR